MKSKFSIALLLFIALSSLTLGQNNVIQIQGNVTAKSNGETMIGVGVTEVDANNRNQSGTVTDANGHYVLKIKNRNNKLEFRYLGYAKQSRAIGNADEINIVMAESQTDLKVVEVVAKKTYGEGAFVIPQREISTAVQTINAKDFEGLQVGSIDEALQGRVAGLDIVSNSGDPGSGSTMRIRGTASINANAEPLLVLNGVPYSAEVDESFDYVNSNQEQWASMLSINPDDILEITVLKDAASTAIWGSKGANGVISITTKKGAIGPTKVQYTYRLTRAVQPKGLNMLNGDDYTMMMKQALFNSKQDEEASNVPELSYQPSFSEYENFNNNTDWVKEVSQTGFTHDHSLTVFGGGDKAQFRVSGGYMNQTGTVIGTGLDRFTTRSTLDYSVSDRLRFGAEFSFSYSNSHSPNGGILGIAYKKMPNVGVYAQDVNGNSTGQYYTISKTSTLNEAQRDLENPVALANMASSDNISYRINPILRIRYDLLNPEVTYLRYDAYFAFDVTDNKSTSFKPWDATNSEWSSDQVNRSTNTISQNSNLQLDNSITWQPRFENRDNNANIMLSHQMRTGSNNSQNIISYGIPSQTSYVPTQEAYLEKIETGRSTYRSVGFLGRLHYSYKSKYVFSGTLRRDGSTKFGDKRKWGNFPGISGKWIISDESFMDFSKGIISEFALRPSWGLSGNEPSSNYLHFSRYISDGSYLDMQATKPQSLRLSDLKWETTSQFNYGADISLFNNKLSMQLNAYNKRTYDLLFGNLSIPSSSGFSTISYSNVGTMDNDGYELNFDAKRVLTSGKFFADFNINFSNNINTVVELDQSVLDTYNKEYDYTNKTYLTRLEVGHSYGSIYGFKNKGVYQYDKYIAGEQESAPVARDEQGRVLVDELGDALPMTFAYGTTSQYTFRGGDAMYEDLNHDGTIDELDIVYLGNSNPLFNGGFGSTLHYKDFACVMFFNYRVGNKIVNRARMEAESMYSYDNQSIAVNWRWRKDGDLTEIPRALYQSGYNFLGSDRYVEDGSFLRFKYLQFNYSVPPSKLKPYKLDRLTLYLNFNNLAVFSSYTGVEPEVSSIGLGGIATDNSKTPRSKDFTLGISVGL